MKPSRRKSGLPEVTGSVPPSPAPLQAGQPPADPRVFVLPVLCLLPAISFPFVYFPLPLFLSGLKQVYSLKSSGRPKYKSVCRLCLLGASGDNPSLHLPAARGTPSLARLGSCPPPPPEALDLCFCQAASSLLQVPVRHWAHLMGQHPHPISSCFNLVTPAKPLWSGGDRDRGICGAVTH